jgi:hypothetical protein
MPTIQIQIPEEPLISLKETPATFSRSQTEFGNAFLSAKRRTFSVRSVESQKLY